MRISDWSSDVCSSDLARRARESHRRPRGQGEHRSRRQRQRRLAAAPRRHGGGNKGGARARAGPADHPVDERGGDRRSEEHTSELQSLMRISYAVFCLKKKQNVVKSTIIRCLSKERANYYSHCKTAYSH